MPQGGVHLGVALLGALFVRQYVIEKVTVAK